MTDFGALCAGTTCSTAWQRSGTTAAGRDAGTFRQAEEKQDGGAVELLGWRRFLPPTLQARWQRPCEAMFETLASQDPAALMKLISSGELESANLTFAAETLGSAA